MRRYLRSMRGAYGICASLVFVAGCGSQTQENSVVPDRLSSPNGADRSAGGSSMVSNANAQDLIYVSHAADGSVYVYSYPKGAPEGRLLNVRANGLCSNKNGDVFIPEGNEVLEYPHGGTRPSAVLHDSLGGAFQLCSVDPSSGGLAVSGGSYSHLGVAVYPEGKGAPKVYAAEGLNAGYWSCAYDDDGNLFVEGFTRALGAAAGGSSARPIKVTVHLFELAKGATRFTRLAWNGRRPARVGSIQWDGQYLAAASPGGGSTPTTILRYAVSARRAAFVGETVLKGAANTVQVWIHGGRIAAPNAGRNGAGSGVAFYAYPLGGGPTALLKDALVPQAAAISLAPKHKFAVTTYHYDNLRTGWNDSESALTAKKVKSGAFGLLHSVTLDDQVDAQPLVVPDETTTRGTSAGKHDVVYVATESNTIYAIDASSGTVLFDQSLGTPVATPLGCNNNGPNVGITGTPVIDLAANVMYVVAYTLESGMPTYRIHELNLSDLTDAVPPVVVAASHKLTNGKNFKFNATYQRQRPALLEANGNVYAGFGSFCDFDASNSRGWLLAWQTGSLTPLSSNRLNDRLAKSPNSFFLSAIWMSGYGVAADPSGNVYFVTGNSDPSGTTYNGVTNVQESVVKVSSDLTQLLSIFTPSDVGYLDEADADFGSGGALLLPSSGSSATPLAAAAGKDGTMFLLDQNDLGGYNPSHNNDLDEKYIGGCWCGQSYFAAGKKSVPHIVASGGNTVTVWKVQASPSVKLVSAGSSPGLPNGQDPGFFTSVSSHGTRQGAIIWAVARPQYVPGNITLFAFKAEPQHGSSALQMLYEGTAGSWTASNGNANLVPVVANGKVYVASYQQLDIFGMGGTAAKAGTRGVAFHAMRGVPNELTGKLVAVSGSLLTLRTRSGKIVRVDAAGALARERSGVLVVGEPFDVRGKYDAAGVLHAAFIVRAKPLPSSWPPDR